MAYSLAETPTLTCPECDASFEAEVWLVVDAAERPDLLDRARSGTLHDVTCPNGHTSTLDAPLLLLRPDADPPLLFSPAQGTSAEQDREQAAGLVGWLREALGDAWRDAWVAQGIPGVQRPLLAAMLSDDPEAALREAAEAAQRELEALRAQDPDAFRQLEEAARAAMERTPLQVAIQKLLNADKWTDVWRLAESHPELLSEEADTLLAQVVDEARAQGDSGAMNHFEAVRSLLRRSNEIGAKAAVAEKMGVAEAELEALEAADQMPPELREVLVAAAASGQAITSPEELQAFLQSRPDLELPRFHGQLGTCGRPVFFLAPFKLHR